MELNNIEINELYDNFKTTTHEITETLIGLRRNLRTEGLSSEVEMLCQNRRQTRLNMLRNPADASNRQIYKTLKQKSKA